MIVTEAVTINGKSFVRTWSDTGFLIARDGVRYSEAVDPAELGRTYTQTEELPEGMSETEEKAAAYDILMGVRE